MPMRKQRAPIGRRSQLVRHTRSNETSREKQVGQGRFQSSDGNLGEFSNHIAFLTIGFILGLVVVHAIVDGSCTHVKAKDGNNEEESIEPIESLIAIQAP